jgi:tetratricopeptide (TPR) repeat protein
LSAWLGNYELVSEVGRGAMGVVFLARSLEGREVAIKVLRNVTPEARSRFERERRLLAAFVEGDGFVPLIDSGDAPDGPFLVMPFLAGGTLRARLERGPLPFEEARTLGVAVARALGCAHGRGIVHRDLKPENILFSDTGRPLVADLGLAKHFDASASGGSQSLSLSVAGGVHGTMGYMPPEQLAAAKDVGPAADVFALAAILYEALAGSAAFPGESVIEVFARVEACSPPALASRRKDAPPWLVRVIERGLARDPAHRFPDGASFARALEAAPRPARRRVAVATLLIVAAACAVAALVLGVRARRVRRARETFELTVATAEVFGSSGSIAGLTSAIALDQGLADAWAWRAEARASDRDLEGGLADAARALELDPRSAMAWAARGMVAIARGDHDGAIRDCTKAVELGPELAFAWCDLAAAKMMKRDLAGAVADFTRAIELRPRCALAWSSRATVRHERGDQEGALADTTRAIEIDPRNAGHWASRGILRGLRGDAQGAIADFDRAIELDPSRGLSHADRGEQLFDAHPDRAFADLSRAIELDPAIGKAWGLRGILWLKRGQPDRALADLDRAVVLAPANAWFWHYRANARIRLGDDGGAIEDEEKAVALDPARAHDNLSLWKARGFLRADGGDVAGAIADLEHFVALAKPQDRLLPEVKAKLAALRARR